MATQEGINKPIFISAAFQQRDRQKSQNLNKDTFHRSPVTSAQCIIGTRRYPDNSIVLNYDDDDYIQVFGLIKEPFRALTRDDILKPYISEQNFRSSKDGDDIGHILHVFDKRYRENFTASQQIKIEFKFFSGNSDAGIYGYAFVLTNKLVSISSDGQRHCDVLLI